MIYVDRNYLCIPFVNQKIVPIFILVFGDEIRFENETLWVDFIHIWHGNIFIFFSLKSDSKVIIFIY